MAKFLNRSSQHDFPPNVKREKKTEERSGFLLIRLNSNQQNMGLHVSPSARTSDTPQQSQGHQSYLNHAFHPSTMILLSEEALVQKMARRHLAPAMPSAKQQPCSLLTRFHTEPNITTILESISLLQLVEYCEGKSGGQNTARRTRANGPCTVLLNKKRAKQPNQKTHDGLRHTNVQNSHRVCMIHDTFPFSFL